MAKETEWSLKDELLEMKAMITRVDEAIRGNGKEGLVTRVVKLEQVAKILIWIAAILTLPIVGLLVKTIYTHYCG